MSNEHPILLIHTAPWCGGCKNLLQPNNMSKITKILKELNPNTEVKIVSNQHWNDTNKTDDIPTVNYIPTFPMLMLMNSSNCNRSGTMNEVRIYNHNWNGSSIVKNEKEESIEAFLRKNVLAITGEIQNKKETPIKKPNPNVSSIQGPTTYNRNENKIKRKERTFRLVGLNE